MQKGLGRNVEWCPKRKRSTSHTEHGIIQQAIAAPGFEVTKKMHPESNFFTGRREQSPIQRC